MLAVVAKEHHGTKYIFYLQTLSESDVMKVFTRCRMQKRVPGSRTF
jgi:hypothetical protein